LQENADSLHQQPEIGSALVSGSRPHSFYALAGMPMVVICVQTTVPGDSLMTSFRGWIRSRDGGDIRMGGTPHLIVSMINVIHNPVDTISDYS
jgi:hypothetical protein